MKPTAILLLCSVALCVHAQEPATLKLTATIPLPGVKGRFDHFALDAKGHRLFVAALGNDTLEVNAMSRSIRSGIRMPPICSRPVSTSGRFNSTSAMPIPARRRRIGDGGLGRRYPGEQVRANPRANQTFANPAPHGAREVPGPPVRLRALANGRV
jgi:hypothetical protein